MNGFVYTCRLYPSNLKPFPFPLDLCHHSMVQRLAFERAAMFGRPLFASSDAVKTYLASLLKSVINQERFPHGKDKILDEQQANHSVILPSHHKIEAYRPELRLRSVAKAG